MFTRKEKKMLFDPYFEVIRETEQFIEVRSVNTGHCWSVFKNTYNSTLKVTLYHKHKENDSYFHQHRACRTVTEAVSQIKAHDAYVMERVKLTEKNPGTKSVRQLKVYETSGYRYQPTPTIILKGKWLKEFGFAVGDSYNVVCENGKLTLTRA